MTPATIRRRIKKLYQRVQDDFAEHRKQFGNSPCLSSCEEAQQFWAKSEALSAAHVAAGGRVLDTSE